MATLDDRGATCASTARERYRPINSVYLFAFNSSFRPYVSVRIIISLLLLLLLLLYAILRICIAFRDRVRILIRRSIVRDDVCMETWRWSITRVRNAFNYRLSTGYSLSRKRALSKPSAVELLLSLSRCEGEPYVWYIQLVRRRMLFRRRDGRADWGRQRIDEEVSHTRARVHTKDLRPGKKEKKPG